MKGMVYWITGLSGAGKTTIGNMLYYRIKAQTNQVIILDGDELKNILSEKTVGYSLASRKIRAYQYAKLCKMLSDQGMIVICCTIAMFDEVREWNRENIGNYIEVFVNVDLDTLQQRDSKGLYSKYAAGEITTLVGMEVEKTEFPKNPDLIIQNTMKGKVDIYVDKILEIAASSHSITENYKDYWNEYYNQKIVSNNPSDFAKFALGYMEKDKKLMDLGCGNGRDSFFFAKQGLKVTAIDLSETAIQMINDSRNQLPIFAVCDDFVKAKTLFHVEYDYYYIRWALHPIEEEQQKILLHSVYNSLIQKGKLFIETRSINDELYGLGIKVGSNSFIYNNHYRKFAKQEELIKQLENIGFKMLYVVEGTGFSVSAESNPTLIRIVAEK